MIILGFTSTMFGLSLLGEKASEGKKYRIVCAQYNLTLTNVTFLENVKNGQNCIRM